MKIAKSRAADQSGSTGLTAKIRGEVQAGEGDGVELREGAQLICCIRAKKSGPQ